MIDTDYNDINPNTPANDGWQMLLATTPLSQIDPTVTVITFLSNGSVDTSLTPPNDLLYAKKVLEPAAIALQVRANLSQTFDLLTLANWMFVSFYWTILLDLGQLSPTLYDPQTKVPTKWPSTNNIFMNQTLFDIYSSYLIESVLPIFNANASDLPPYDNVIRENFFKARKSTTFIKSYSCLQRQLKPWLGAAISIIVADYALIGAPYALILFIAAQIQKRRGRNCECFL